MDYLEKLKEERKKIDELLHRLDGLHGSLTILESEWGIKDHDRLSAAIEPLEEYLEETIDDLVYYAEEENTRELKAWTYDLVAKLDPFYGETLKEYL